MEKQELIKDIANLLQKHGITKEESEDISIFEETDKIQIEKNIINLIEMYKEKYNISNIKSLIIKLAKTKI